MRYSELFYEPGRVAKASVDASVRRRKMSTGHGEGSVLSTQRTKQIVHMMSLVYLCSCFG